MKTVTSYDVTSLESADSVQTERQMDAGSNIPVLAEPAWFPELDYLTDYTHAPVTNPALWRPINFVRRNRGLYNLAKGLRSIQKNGIKEIGRIIRARFRPDQPSLAAETQLSKHDRLAQEGTVFPKQITISIITPLYNTPPQHLEQMIESVLAQTYKNWELCLADGSGREHDYVADIGRNYAERDNRIKYCKIEGNPGISASSNKAMEISGGEYIGILDHDDVLHPGALYEVMKAICEEDADFLYSDEAAFSHNHRVFLKHHKPDYAFDTLCSCNYISHFTVFSRALMNRAGMFRSEFDGSHDYDLILRYTDSAAKVHHISKLLYFRRSQEEAGESYLNHKLHSASAAENAIREHLKKRGISAQVEKKFGLPGFYRVTYALTETPRVSIIIPNKDNVTLLRNCLSSIIERTTYTNYEIIVVENNSTKDATFAYYEEIKRYPNITVVYWEGKGFSYSEICNFGARYARGKQLVFLNNDVVVITPNWLEEMLMYSQRSDVGMVGIKLYFLNGSVQHAGMVLGLGGAAGHIYLGAHYDDIGFMAKLQITQNMSAVTAACVMIKKQVFQEVGLFAPEFCDSYNDVDLCLKVRKAGYLIVWTPHAEAYHLESKSRGYYTTSRRKREITHETNLFNKKWGKVLAAGDPYYNCNYSLDKADYSLK